MPKLYKVKEGPLEPLESPKMRTVLMGAEFQCRAKEQVKIDPIGEAPAPPKYDEFIDAYRKKICEGLKVPPEVLGIEGNQDSDVCSDCNGTGKIQLLTSYSECDCQKNEKEKHTSHTDPPSEGASTRFETLKRRAKYRKKRGRKKRRKRKKTKGSRRRKTPRQND